MLSVQCMCFVKKFNLHTLSVTSNFPHSVLTDVFDVTTTKRFLFVLPVLSEVVNLSAVKTPLGYIKVLTKL